MIGRVVVIAQARMGSTRLPGKVLERIGERSAMTHVLLRARSIPGVDAVCCATTRMTNDDPVAAEAARNGFDIYRGDEQDVLARYAEAASRFDATTILRITCDCPLLDPFVCGNLLQLYSSERADYGATNLSATWPHGLDCEVFTADALRQAQAKATSSHDREHVTAWMRRHPSLRRVSLEGPGGEAAQLRWTLDYPEDLLFLRALADHCDIEKILRWQDIATVIKGNPKLQSINMVRHNPERPGSALDSTARTSHNA